MEKADGKLDACGLHTSWDYEEALEKFLKRRSKMKAIYSYKDAYIRANCTTEDKIDAVRRWMGLGESREHIIFLDTVLMNIYRAEKLEMERIMRLCRAEDVQALEIIAIEKYVEEDDEDGGNVQDS